LRRSAGFESALAGEGVIAECARSILSLRDLKNEHASTLYDGQETQAGRVSVKAPRATVGQRDGARQKARVAPEQGAAGYWAANAAVKLSNSAIALEVLRGQRSWRSPV
jgi:hypothetical protein